QQFVARGGCLWPPARQTAVHPCGAGAAWPIALVRTRRIAAADAIERLACAAVVRGWSDAQRGRAAPRAGRVCSAASLGLAGAAGHRAAECGVATWAKPWRALPYRHGTHHALPHGGCHLICIRAGNF